MRTYKRTPPSLLTRARELRAVATVPEKLLWGALRNRRLGGLKVKRQYPIGLYVADFYVETAKLVIEIDGRSHYGQAEYDERRERFLREKGLNIVRFSNDEVLADIEAVKLKIAHAAGLLEG